MGGEGKETANREMNNTIIIRVSQCISAHWLGPISSQATRLKWPHSKQESNPQEQEGDAVVFQKMLGAKLMQSFSRN